MFDRGSVGYEYDGTFEGFLSCVFESFERRETPLDIQPSGAPQLTLNPLRPVKTDLHKAERVRRSIPLRISQDAMELTEHVFLTFLEHKELYMLKFLQMGFSIGPDVTRLLQDDTVCALLKAQKHLYNESHRFKQFLRFSVTGRVLAAVIKPMNQVLPLIAPHFTDRYPEEAFLIYDETHGMALVHRPGEAAIVPVDSFVIDDPDEQEQMYRDLWCDYYDTIAIEGRYNPKCRMNHMPKRYWDTMTEFCRSQKPGLRRNSP